MVKACLERLADTATTDTDPNNTDADADDSDAEPRVPHDSRVADAPLRP